MALLNNRDREERPWGSFERFTLNEHSTVKVLRLNPSAEISLQRHENRAEFWRILEGSGVVTVGGSRHEAKAGDEFEISAQTMHRIKANEGGLTWLEIAIGTFEEHDEERLADDFGRA